MHEMTPEKMEWTRRSVQALERRDEHEARRHDAEFAHVRHVRVRQIRQSAVHPDAATHGDLGTAVTDGRLLSD